MNFFKYKSVQSDSQSGSLNTDNSGTADIVNVDASTAAAFRNYHTDPEVRAKFDAGARIAARSSGSSSSDSE